MLHDHQDKREESLVSVQDRPICWRCETKIEIEPVYAAPCDHDECPSAVFHGLCLMEWREERNRAEEAMRDFFRAMNERNL